MNSAGPVVAEQSLFHAVAGSARVAIEFETRENCPCRAGLFRSAARPRSGAAPNSFSTRLPELDTWPDQTWTTS